MKVVQHFHQFMVSVCLYLSFESPPGISTIQSFTVLPFSCTLPSTVLTKSFIVPMHQINVALLGGKTHFLIWTFP